MIALFLSVFICVFSGNTITYTDQRLYCSIWHILNTECHLKRNLKENLGMILLLVRPKKRNLSGIMSMHCIDPSTIRRHFLPNIHLARFFILSPDDIICQGNLIFSYSLDITLILYCWFVCNNCILFIKKKKGDHDDAREITAYRKYLGKIKSNNSLILKEDVERKIIEFSLKSVFSFVFLHVYFKKNRTQTYQNTFLF